MPAILPFLGTMEGSSGRPENRVSPEEFLTIANEEERKKNRGKFTVYLGYAAGVGKTYAMLSDGIQKRAEGHEVVIGYVETHGRADTDALARKLRSVPVRGVSYAGMTLREPDIDALLALRPEIVLVDELAHTNAPGMRNLKRYQDVEELLNAGISVFTTLNIQHLESLNDALLQITGITVKETVPDTILQRADDIKLIDIPPDELQERLREGKVYVQDMAAEAVIRFFETGNLMALRQLALRQVAGVTDQRMLLHKRLKAIDSPWPATERVLVGIRPSPYAERMVRAAYRMSVRLNADWEVLYVETEEYSRLSDQEQAWLEEAFSTTHSLGGHIVRYPANSIADELIRYAQAHNVTMIILGKPRGLDILISPVYRVMRMAKGIDIYLFDWKSEFRSPIHWQLPRLLPRHYLVGSVGVAAATLVNYMLLGTISEANMLIIQLVPVVLVAYFFGYGASIFTAIFSILVFSFFFVEPYYTLSLSDWEYFISFVGYVIIALVISYLATRLRYVAQQIWRSEVKSSALSGLSRGLAEAKDREEVLNLLTSHGKELGAEKVAVYLPADGSIGVAAGDRDYPNTAKEDTIATWTFQNGLPAGKGTGTLSWASGTYIPLKAHKATIGVIGLHFSPKMQEMPADLLETLETVGNLGAIALERFVQEADS
jgi:two-component system sensor histidine kinase KdpD